MSGLAVVSTLLGSAVSSAFATQESAKKDLVVSPDRAVEESTWLTGHRVYWHQGVNLESADRTFSLKLGGRVQVDAGTGGPDRAARTGLQINDIGADALVRRGRLYLGGTLHSHYRFRVQYDFAQNAFNDVYLEVYDVPILQRVRLGHFKEPFSLEQLASSNDNMFMERGLPNAFVPGRNTGIGVHQTYFDQHFTWAIGVFAETAEASILRDIEAGGSLGANLTTRLTALPHYQDHGRRLALLGLSFTHKFRSDKDISFSQAPESSLAPVFVDTGTLLTDGVTIINPELAAVWGPASVQAEYVRAFVTLAPEGSAQFDGLYVFASYFLTAEHRTFSTAKATFGRIIPHQNFLRDDFRGLAAGWGAWELAGRFSRIDLDTEGVSGGILNDITVGVNWYLNPTIRLTFNYVFADLESVGDTNIVQGKFQIAF